MKRFFSVAFFVFISIFLFAQSTYFKSEEAFAVGAAGAKPSSVAFAEQDFRRGVQSYYRGSFNDAILEFEKSLSYLPSENLILDWLGKAYYRSGMEGTALQQWQFASNAGYGGLLLQNRIEIVKARRITDNNYSDDIRYTEAGTFPGERDKTMIFSQPISALPNADGTFWVLAYGSNELLRIDVNGQAVDRLRGPLNGFDRPIDIARLKDGNLLISESAGDRLCVISPIGIFKKYIGEKGRGVGQIIGPQYIDISDNGSIFVSDFGNARVDVFDKDGEGLFFFGGKTTGFSGLKGPTGIAILDDVVYVADAVTGGIYKFDESGNYLGILCKPKTFIRPESLKVLGKVLVLCDKNKIYTINAKTGSTFLNVRTGSAPSRVTSAVPDINGNLLATDFRSNEVYLMSKLNEIVGGLFVQIERVYAENFPNITLELKVENRNRQGIVGLKDVNFLITENKRPCSNVKFEGAATFNDVADITILIDRSTENAKNADALETAVKEIAKAMNGKGTVRVVSAGAIPGTEYEGKPAGLLDFSEKALKTKTADFVPLDLAVRLSANSLINAEKKRAIIYLSSGETTQGAFDKYGLSDLSAYLNNNSIAFLTVLLENKAIGKDLEYLCESTNGDEYYVYRSEGISEIINDVLEIPTGMYRMSYTSALQTDFGRAYLPVEVEAYLMNRSGRDETGYFAPLQ